MESSDGCIHGNGNGEDLDEHFSELTTAVCISGSELLVRRARPATRRVRPATRRVVILLRIFVTFGQLLKPC